MRRLRRRDRVDGECQRTPVPYPVGTSQPESEHWHQGYAVLTTGLSPELIRGLALPRASGWVPRLYAGFGGRVGRGLPVPERLRPSPLAYIFRVLGDKDAAEPIHRLLLTRRFEFFDFDVV